MSGRDTVDAEGSGNNLVSFPGFMVLCISRWNNICLLGGRRCLWESVGCTCEN